MFVKCIKVKSLPIAAIKTVKLWSNGVLTVILANCSIIFSKSIFMI